MVHRISRNLHILILVISNGSRKPKEPATPKNIVYTTRVARSTTMIGLPKHKLSPLPIDHRSQEKFNLRLSTLKKLPPTSSQHGTSKGSHRRKRTKKSSSSSASLLLYHAPTAKRSYSVGALQVDRGSRQLHDMPNLQQYVTPSLRSTMEEIPTAHVPAPVTVSSTTRRATARAETLRREKYALRALSKQAGMGTAKVRFRSNRVGGEVALTQVTTGWMESAENLRQSSRLSPETSSSSSSSPSLPSNVELEQCLQALEMLPPHLAVVVPTLRRALYSNSYAGMSEIRASTTAASSAEFNDACVLDTLPYYSVCHGLETTNRHLLEDMEELKMMLERVKKERDGHRELLKMSNQKNHELREKVSKAEQDKQVIYNQLCNMREIASDHLEDNNNTTERYVDLDIQHSSLRTKHEHVSTQLSDLKEVYSSVSRELGSALRACGQLETQAKAYRKQIDEASKTLAEHANLKAQYEQMSMQYENTKDELDMARDEVRRYKNRKASHALVKMGMMDAKEKLPV